MNLTNSTSVWCSPDCYVAERRRFPLFDDQHCYPLFPYFLFWFNGMMFIPVPVNAVVGSKFLLLAFSPDTHIHTPCIFIFSTKLTSQFYLLQAVIRKNPYTIQTGKTLQTYLQILLILWQGHSSLICYGHQAITIHGWWTQTSLPANN